MAKFWIKADAYSAIEEKYRCAHDNRELRLRVIADGRTAHYRQCLICGYAGNAVPKKSVRTELQGQSAPPFDNDLEYRWHGRKHAEYFFTYKEIKPMLRAEYEKYLASEAWSQRRSATIQAANGICQCCEHFPATQAHHVTYERIGTESASDLMAVCSFCHELLHGKHALEPIIPTDAAR